MWLTYSLGSSPTNFGWREWSKEQEYCMRKNGAHLGTRSVIHNAIWPSLVSNRKYLSMCVFREPSSLCGEREEENISGTMYYIQVWATPVSPLFCHWLFFQLPWRLSVHPGRAFTHTIRVCLLWFCVVYIFDFLFKSKFLFLWTCSRRHILTAACSAQL